MCRVASLEKPAFLGALFCGPFLFRAVNRAAGWPSLCSAYISMHHHMRASLNDFAIARFCVQFVVAYRTRVIAF